jgi:4-aminobutyrate aminotransferase
VRHDPGMGKLAGVWSQVTRLEVSHGEGAWVVTPGGERYLDFTSGIAVTSTGHAHPVVVDAIARQAARIVHAQVNCYRHDLLQPLADVLEEITPAGVDTFFYTNSGAEATEGAVKLAKQHTRRPYVVVLDGSFHGRTHMTMAMTTSKSTYRYGYGTLPGGVLVVPFAEDDAAVDAAVSGFERVVHTQAAPDEVACVIVELVQGEGGYRAVAPRYVEHLRSWCAANGALFVADEVQTGFGRTGTMFASEQYHLSPDIVVMAKGIASGFPFAAVGARSRVMDDWVPGSHGGTYGGNPVGCAAALATIGLLRDGLVENASRRGAQLRDGLDAVRHPAFVRTSGLGMMCGAVLASAEAAGAVRDGMQQRGVLVMTAGGGQVLRFMPPLVVSADEVQLALDAFAGAVGSL